MNTRTLLARLAVVLIPAVATAEDTSQYYTNFIRQVQVASGSAWDVQDIPQSGEQLSPLPIDPGGARFELWTVRDSTLADTLLDQVYVGTYVPQATLEIRTEDPYLTRPRTRADRPFRVVLDIDGMSSDPSAPAAARFLKFQHHVQSYGEDGVGLDTDPADATLTSEQYIGSNGTYTFDYTLTTVPGADRAKVRGEERFTAWSLPDYQAPESVLAQRTIQIWPVADGGISGIEDGDQLRFLTPKLTITLNDLYPDSRTYAQLYKGSAALGTEGKVVQGSAIIINDAIPQDRVLVIDDWDKIIESSGQWTMELLTETPFGVDRLDYVTFNINRDIEVNGTVTTVEK